MEWVSTSGRRARGSRPRDGFQPAPDVLAHAARMQALDLAGHDYGRRGIFTLPDDSSFRRAAQNFQRPIESALLVVVGTITLPAARTPLDIAPIRSGSPANTSIRSPVDVPNPGLDSGPSRQGTGPSSSVEPPYAPEGSDSGDADPAPPQSRLIPTQGGLKESPTATFEVSNPS